VNVHDFFANQNLSKFIEEKEIISLSGWLVIIDSRLFLLDEMLLTPYTETKKIQISNTEIAFSVRDCTSPLGGGKSFVFHKSIIDGVVIFTDSLKIDVTRLLIQRDDIQNKYVDVDLSFSAIQRAKDKYGSHLLRPHHRDSDDWLDFA
jgi:hypothetical protein